MDIEHALEIAQESKDGGYTSIVNEALHFLADRITDHTNIKSNRNWRIENERQAEQIKQLTEERDALKGVIKTLRDVLEANVNTNVCKSAAQNMAYSLGRKALKEIK